MTDLRPETYYSTTLPAQYQAALRNADPAVLDQPEITANVEITDGEQGIYGLRARGDTLEYVKGGVADPDLHTRISLQDWHTMVAHGVAEQVLDYMLRRKVAVVKSIGGTVTLELTRPDGSTFTNVTTFMGQAEPAVTLMMTSDDYSAMNRGDLNGQMAFMLGKLKFEGSLPLLMAIGALTS
jgi:putative sterol carrier protein